MIPLEPWWIVGFVDGEGCFSIDLINNATMTLGIQVQANFSVTQGIRSLSALERIQAYFGCGQIQSNPRRDNHREDLAIYRVRRLSDLQQIIIPFFVSHPLQTAKANDFALFAEGVSMMTRGEHLAEVGLQAIRQLKLRMRLLGQEVREKDVESSETRRQAPERVKV
jgi:LAGLIDADG endonuclease